MTAPKLFGVVPSKSNLLRGTYLLLHLARATKCETTIHHHLLLYLASRAGQDGTFRVSIDTIMSDTTYSRSTVHRRLADFKHAGILTWVKGHGNRHTKINGVPSTYAFNFAKFAKLPKIVNCNPRPPADKAAKA